MDPRDDGIRAVAALRRIGRRVADANAANGASGKALTGLRVAIDG
jgi:hypothetical protein